MIEANNAMMALLVGAQFASASLSMSAGSTTLISNMYPGVQHIERFQLRPERAQAELDASEEHLAKIAIPYALSVHEDFIQKVKEDLSKANISLALNGRKWNAENMHSIVFDSLQISPVPDLTSFDLFRRIRNALIHAGGSVDDYLEEGLENLTPEALEHWETTSKRPPSSIIESGQVLLGAGEIMLAFSIVRYLSKNVHQGMIDSFPRAFWLEDCTQDFIALNRGALQKKRLLRTKLERWASYYYEDFEFTWQELRLSAQAAGLPPELLRKRGEPVELSPA